MCIWLTTTEKVKGGGFTDFLTAAGSLATGLGSVMTGWQALGGVGLAGAGAGGSGFTSAGGLGLAASNW